MKRLFRLIRTALHRGGAVIAGLWKAAMAWLIVRSIFPLLMRFISRKTANRDFPNLLILRYSRYATGSVQDSTEKFQVDNTLLDSGLATFDVLTYDDDLCFSPLADIRFVTKCLSEQPAAVILSSWWFSAKHPSLSAIRLIRSHLKIPICVIWWDTCSKQFWQIVEPLLGDFDLHVVIDNPRLEYANQSSAFFERVMCLWPPQDRSLFLPRGNRDITYSFVGQAGSYRGYRKEVIDYVERHCVPGYVSMVDRNNQISHLEYAETMARSNLCINFSRSVNCDQAKSRVLEALFSGSLLLESENAQTATLFTPMKHYVPFSSKEDLAEKIGYYLEHLDQARQIAICGQNAAEDQYSNGKFWRLLLARLIPHHFARDDRLI